MKPTKCPGKEDGRRKRKGKVKTAVPLLNPKTTLKFCFLHICELRKLLFCMWIRRLQSTQLVKGFVVSFSIFLQNSQEQMG